MTIHIISTSFCEVDSIASKEFSQIDTKHQLDISSFTIHCCLARTSCDILVYQDLYTVPSTI